MAAATASTASPARALVPCEVRGCYVSVLIPSEHQERELVADSWNVGILPRVALQGIPWVKTAAIAWTTGLIEES